MQLISIKVILHCACFVLLQLYNICAREWLSGRASPCQGERREFESRLPLQTRNKLCLFRVFLILSNILRYFTKFDKNYLLNVKNVI